MNRPKVSIITPCYNCEKTIHRLISSLIRQTYGNIEFIFINDGSTDGSLDVLIKNEDLFYDNKIEIKIIDQENQGVGGAINSGLKVVDGEYLCWIDADDYLETRSIEEKVNFLELNTEFGAVTTNGFIFRHPNYTKPIALSGDNLDNANHRQFNLLLMERSVFIPAAHMIKMSSLRDVNPSLQIFPASRGQNWQLLLPVYYKYKRGYIEEPLFNYVVYENSLSRGDNTFIKKILRNDEHEEILQKVIQSIKMPNSEKEFYSKFIKVRYLRKKMLAASIYNNKDFAISIFRELREISIINAKDIFIIIFSFLPFGETFKVSLFNFISEVIKCFKTFR